MTKSNVDFLKIFIIIFGFLSNNKTSFYDTCTLESTKFWRNTLSLYYLHISKRAEDLQNENLNLCYTRTKKAEQNVAECFNPIKQLIINNYGENFASAVANSKVFEAMPEELFVLSWGRPDEVKENFYKDSLIEKWYYQPFYNRLGNKKHRVEVTIENKRVIGWKDLN